MIDCHAIIQKLIKSQYQRRKVHRSRSLDPSDIYNELLPYLQLRASSRIYSLERDGLRDPAGQTLDNATVPKLTALTPSCVTVVKKKISSDFHLCYICISFEKEISPSDRNLIVLKNSMLRILRAVLLQREKDSVASMKYYLTPVMPL